MSKVLSQSGISLADQYDVEGSVAGIEDLNSRDVSLVHEMGQTLFSERLGATIRRTSSGAIGQSDVWDNVIVTFPTAPFRILGVIVLSDDATRLSVVTVSIRSTQQVREMPIFEWDTNEGAVTSRIDQEGAGAANTSTLIPARSTGWPTLGVGSLSRQEVGAIAFRGSTNAFGAGDVTTIALIHIAFAQQAGLSSYGLPIPGW